ncbi:hypothetical protein CE91St46_10850 [Eubacteriales bacterium]|uniref:CAP domain-containing protein n=1 Tax=Anaerotruncus TaxID=244127 RepID=UPI000E4BCD58|nr:CAP domain-containing protein [Anaerotruncus sp. AF02-27]RGX53439.1 CAP domain-containing protein [Anaerotruncus sp. AF02-27]GKH48136.1 hypothetical protein CE91St45_26980 [Oscillospiraceae bacterium]GKH49974.1 hypothetical protein CE91St46_10850 [Eubacteriales bacterium]GKH62610.1 hypothetical protein CE91St47_10790 [Eubacteriales bacterium]
MKRKIFVGLAALLVVGAGAFYAVLSGYFQLGTPAPAAEPMEQNAADGSAQSSAARQDEIDELRRLVEELSAALKQSAEKSTSEPEPASAQEAPVSSATAVPTPESDASSTATAVKASEAPPPAAPAAKENAGTVFEGCTVTVTDKDTPAVRAAGTGWPITKYYFVAEDGDYLGSISGAAMNAIIEKYQTGAGDAPGNGGEWEFWFAEQFNEYRGVSQYMADTTERASNSSNSGGASAQDVDTDAYALEVIDLINQKREDIGLENLQIDSSLTSHSEIRAEELSIQYSHVRPDGTKEKSECIVMRRDTPLEAVEAWMDSDPHRDAILDESGRFPYQRIGSGCYQDESGVLYWVITFGL